MSSKRLLVQHGKNNPSVQKGQKASLPCFLPSPLRFPSLEGLGVGSASCLLVALLSVPLFPDGLAIARTKNQNLLTDNTRAHNHHHHDGGMNGEKEGHSHGTREITRGQPVPTVDLIVHEDT
ncbi:MAG: hypothetical protein F6J86_28415, partial [Symploca sp. SIO1B1]|nr:hypothetical protein [Symploca sp. SIO1B1]